MFVTNIHTHDLARVTFQIYADSLGRIRGKKKPPNVELIRDCCLFFIQLWFAVSKRNSFQCIRGSADCHFSGNGNDKRDILQSE